ncbi:hypothetical protein PG994_003941 [Apiospora phragmitis]|uniref:Zn(2)-C6 fungal-type domain-containing protein n=1 Tax=Apiospora phragmitis TaxID=2905665 RepID=A0ABR1W3C6_9PEZI
MAERFKALDSSGSLTCTWKREDDRCDRYIDHGLQCRLPRPARVSSIEVKGEAESTRASTSETDRHHLLSFSSAIRVAGTIRQKWPEKCERCIEKGFDCTRPRSKKDYEEHDAQQGRAPASRSADTAGNQPQQQQRQASHHHTKGMLMPIDPAEDSDHADNGEEQPDILISGGRPPPPAKRQRTDNGDQGRAGAGAVIAAAMATAAASNATAGGGGGGSAENNLHKTIHTMEEEFQEVLRAEQKRHSAEIRAIKDKYEQELAQQRERYERRIDNLIKIMKSIGRVD